MGKHNCLDQLDLFNDVAACCVICGGPFTKPRQTKYCSHPCRDRAAYLWQLSSGYRTGRGREKRKQWMDANRARLEEQATEQRTCSWCGESYLTRYRPQKFCSQKCAGASIRIEREPKPPYIPPSPGPVRQAIIDQDWPALMEAMRAKTTLTDKDCWEWAQSLDASGYGVVRTVANKKRPAHRVMAMAMTGGPVPSHLPVHHKCANRSCINPDHLQIVEPYENTAEMLERNYYLRRIAELEGALEVARGWQAA